MARGKNVFFEGIRGALEEGVAALRAGKKLTRRHVVLPDPPAAMGGEEVLALRRRINVSQHVFARLLNVAPQTVQAWEQGRNEPAGGTLRLLRLAEVEPGVLTGILTAGGAGGSVGSAVGRRVSAAKATSAKAARNRAARTDRSKARAGAARRRSGR